MNFRITAILAVIAIAVVGGLYWWENIREKPPETPPAGAPVALWGVKPEAVTGVKIVAADGNTVEVIREGEGWKMVAPSQEPADTTRVDTVVRQLADARSIRKIEAKDVNPADFELQKPAYVVTLTTAGGLQVLSIGGQTADKTSYYTQKAGDPGVYLINNLAITGATALVANPPKQPTPAPALTILPGDPVGTPAPKSTP
jgi:hypothetical protein